MTSSWMTSSSTASDSDGASSSPASRSAANPSPVSRVAAMLSARTATLWGTAMLLMMTLSGCGTNLIDRIQQPHWGLCGTLVIILDIVALIDVIGDEKRDTMNKVIWAIVIVFMPVVGVLLYFFFGR